MQKKSSQENQKKRSADLTDIIFDRLVEAIVPREFPPEANQREAGIAKSWGISGTPVREVVKAI